MPRVRNVGATRKRHKRVLNKTKGYFGNASRLYRYAKQAMWRAGQYAYIHRKKKKTEFRQLWIIRLNAAVREHGITYCRFIAGLKGAGIEVDRKQLSELAIHDEPAFAVLVKQAKAALEQQA